MSVEMRRAMIERARERVAAHDLCFESDPRFLAIEERWISGELTIAQFRSEYLELMMQRQEDAWLKRAFARSKR